MGLLLFSMTPLIFRNYASAYPGTCAANFLPNYFVAGLDTSNEIWLSEQTANYIVSVLNSKYPIFDYRNSACTDSNFKTILTSLQSYDKAVIYSKGHRDATYFGGYSHYGLAMNNAATGGTVWDYDIYTRTSSKNTHTFIWHCETAIPLTNPSNDTYGCRQLQRAFTHNYNIPLWGTSGSQVYLGWTNNVPQYNYPLTAGSPQYEWNINYNYNYAQVASVYYYYMGQNYATSAALISMSNMIYGTSFQNTDLGNWLEVYGNMNAKLP